MDLSSNEVGYICDNSNFRLCRLAGTLENSGCDYFTITSEAKDPKVSDIISFILSIIVFLFFCLFLGAFKDYALKYQNQRATRGKLFYRTHLIAMGIQSLIWGIEQSLIPIDCSALHFFIVLRYVFLNIGEVMLLFIGLLDSHIISGSRVTFFVSLGISIVVGAASFAMMSESVAKKTIVIFGIGIPMGCAFFHFLSMIVVCAIRKLKSAAGYAFMMLACNFLPIIFEIFVNEPLCTVSAGYFTGNALAVLVLAFYRVFISLFYTELKKVERVDGLGGERKILKGPGEDDSDLPAIIDLDDYPYDYTYSEVSEDY
jgi:hypothetical protein